MNEPDQNTCRHPESPGRSCPHVDPRQEAIADRIRIMKPIPYHEALAKHGLDIETVIQQMRDDDAAIEAAGLPWFKEMAGFHRRDREPAATSERTFNDPESRT